MAHNSNALIFCVLVESLILLYRGWRASKERN
jgi:hypothetical protein